MQIGRAMVKGGYTGHWAGDLADVAVYDRIVVDLAGNRLTETQHAAAGQSAVERTYRYPEAGQAQPHTLSQVTEATSAGERLYTYQYDKAGNTTKRTRVGEEQNLVWDAEGNLASVTTGDKKTSFIYDADGNRLVRDEPDALTVYMGGMELRLDKSSNVVSGTRFYPVTDKVMVVRTVKGMQIQVADHHGTGQAAVDGSSGALTYRRSTPFGGPRGTQPEGEQWIGDKGFVGGTRDKTTGLTHLGAREYDPETGRFISVDPLIDSADPQQMHGYAYANNSPMSFSDPDGLIEVATERGGAEEDRYWREQGKKLVRAAGGEWNIVPAAPNLPQTTRPAEPPEVTSARAAVDQAKQTVIAVAKELGQILMEELGIKDAVDCFINGDMGGCFNTALNVVMSAVGGAAGKLLARYWNKWGKAKELGKRLWDLGGRLKDAIGSWLKNRKRVDEVVSSATSCPTKNSFVPGTLVLMADGSAKPLEDVAVGDEVVATDPETGETASKTVVATIVGEGAKNLVRVTVDLDGKAGSKSASLVATDGHPFWVAELRQWLDATDLHAGQWLRTSAGTWVQITSVQRWTQSARVHNLTVDDIHTYYVLAANTPVLVHNCGDEIGLDSAGEAYVKSKHTVDGPKYDETKGVFNDDEDLYELAEKANDFPGKLQDNGNCAHVCTANHIVGRESMRDGSTPTKVYTVIVGDYGSVVTMHPGLPR